ncbi:MAG: DoxX family protein [Bacteroidetes bacterium]|nr:DoxX family protein [Bacteroidota bacterium]
MKLFIGVSRFLVGLLFIFSGLIKANDPLGLSYKMQEFFEVWNFHLLDNFTLAFSVIMIVFEIIAGVAILLGWRMRLFSWLLLLLIIFFTFLTGYAYLTGKVKECGCFGNCIPLTAGESFTKDVVLLALILFLFANRNKIKPILPQVPSIAILIFATIVSFSFQWFVLQHLPAIDCMPYQVGVNILEGMKPPPGAIPDSTIITFVYNKNGEKIEFTADDFPKDFDSTYKFVKRYDKLIRKGNAEPSIKDFNLITLSGADSTQEILEQKGFKLFVFVKELADPNPSWNKEFAAIYTFAKSKHVPVYFITADEGHMLAFIQRNNLVEGIQLLKCDATAIKTAARVNPTLYLIKGATVADKWAGADFDKAILAMNELPEK